MGSNTNFDLDLSLYPRWNDTCVWRPAEEGLVVIKITESEEKHHDHQTARLNYESRDIWLLCTGENTIRDIADTLSKEYEGDRNVIREDISKMISTLEKEGFLTLEKSPRAAERKLDENACPKRNDDVISNVVEDKFVMMNVKTSEVHSFDKDVKYIWNICDSTHTVGEIVSAAANAGETAFLLQYLTKLGFLEFEPEPKST